MALDSLFGGSSDPQITTIPAPSANIPNQNELNSIAQARTLASSPWTYGPYRAMDYFRNAQVTQNMLPQFSNSSGSMGGAGFLSPQLAMGQMGALYNQPMQQQMNQQMGSPQGLMGDFSNPMAAMMQPQFSPLAWAMQLGQLYSQLGALYQNQQGMPQTQGQQQAAQQTQPTAQSQQEGTA